MSPSPPTPPSPSPPPLLRINAARGPPPTRHCPHSALLSQSPPPRVRCESIPKRLFRAEGCAVPKGFRLYSAHVLRSPHRTERGVPLFQPPPPPPPHRPQILRAKFPLPSPKPTAVGKSFAPRVSVRAHRGGHPRGILGTKPSNTGAAGFCQAEVQELVRREKRKENRTDFPPLCPSSPTPPKQPPYPPPEIKAHIFHDVHR